MKTKIIALAFLACIGSPIQAQDIKTENPKGKAIVQIFGNFHTGLGRRKDTRAFELERSYLGYEYKWGSDLLIKGVMDIGKSSNVSDFHRIAYIKNAMISWKIGSILLNGGLISTTQFDFQEKFWGYRYIMKSFQDQYKFGSSADLGLSVSYRIADWVSADAIIVNGEGYKKIQKNNGLNYGLGVTLRPVSGLQIRLYGGMNEKSEKGEQDIVNMAAFVGYRSDRFTIGAEYDHMLNALYNAGADQSGYSVFASVKMAENVDLYARFDDLYSRNGWNKDKDERVAVLGAQFKWGNHVKFAPNLRMNISKASGTGIGYSAYMNYYFGI